VATDRPGIHHDMINPVRIRTLENTDAGALLAFELVNRAWFERHIDARAPAFYSLPGVVDHIASYLNEFDAGTWHPFVIESVGGGIVGRANLKTIDMTNRSAEIGYRIAESACGQGFATLAVKHLVQEARARWKLGQLVAYVDAQNAGSVKVLERYGFVDENNTRRGSDVDDYRFSLRI